ncbi:MAG: hypothetical protein C0467_16890 [Planctomycetaceae bacterium]|nr:hypothetical protein [Planctomycetaceae bacterium]
MRSRLGPVLLFATIVTGSILFPGSPTQTAAQEKKDEKKTTPGKADPAKQKAAALATLKKAGLDKATVVETDNFLIASSLPEDKAKSLGTVLEKVVPVARKALQFEEKEDAWKGKLTVFVLPETREFKSFMRGVIQRDPQGVYYDLRSDDPFIADPVDVPVKSTEADQFAYIASSVANAYLQARGSTASLPDWLQNGFGRITAMRAEGTNSARYTKYRTAARLTVLGPKGGKPAALGELWGDTKPANGDLLATSIVEYIAYGPGAMNFVKLIYGFRPNENGDSPSTAQAMEAAGWKDTAALEGAWRKWAGAK